MSIVIDLVIIAIILLCLWRGYRKGLIGLAFSIVSFIAALIIAFILFTPISSFVIDNTEFDDNIKSAIINNFNQEEKEQSVASESEDVASESGEGILSTEDRLNKENTNFMTEYINEQIDEVAGNTLEVVATQISELCIKGIVFILLFIVARIGLVFFKVIANLIAKLPILKQFNKLGGIIFGLLKGFVITYGVLAILLLVSPMFNDAGLFNAIEDSFVGSMMYNNNIIIKMLF